MSDFQFQFVIRKGPNVGEKIPLDAPALVVGRDPMSDVVINDPEVSRQHARLTRTGDSYQIQDLGSTNGTFINDNRMAASPHLLQNGDQVSMGSSITLIFEAIPIAAPAADATVVGDFGDLMGDTPDTPADNVAADPFDAFDAPPPPAEPLPETDPFDAFDAPSPPAAEPDPFDEFDAPPAAAAPPPLGEPDPFDEFQSAPPPAADPFDAFDAPAAAPPPPQQPQFAQPAAAATPPPVSAEDESKKKRNRIIIIVAVVLLLCCCLFIAILWFTGDALVQFLEDQMFNDILLPLVAVITS